MREEGWTRRALLASALVFVAAIAGAAVRPAPARADLLPPGTDLLPPVSTPLVTTPPVSVPDVGGVVGGLLTTVSSLVQDAPALPAVPTPPTLPVTPPTTLPVTPPTTLPTVPTTAAPAPVPTSAPRSVAATGQAVATTPP